MEVHHHALTSRKKWTHYLWEFLMLFLAVFCGFLAEYKLEHLIEHTKEKEYMRSMVEDLAQDTIEINRVTISLGASRLGLDTLLNLLESGVYSDSGDLKKMYRIHFADAGYVPAILSQRTLSQLKNAGGLRLIQHKSIADTISVYDTKSQQLALTQKSFDEISTQVYLKGAEIFDSRYYRKYIVTGDVKLLTADARILRPYANHLFMDQAINEYYGKKLAEQKGLAIDLIRSIREKYHHK
ncbi:MAG TPA: hypothetical protein VMZ03_05470 [Chitinophagaceae bacterium]|nr:hypothetical protein [Chitinophagaceae bacterium]